jgi:hypothetical protein
MCAAQSVVSSRYFWGFSNPKMQHSGIVPKTHFLPLLK